MDRKSKPDDHPERMVLKMMTGIHGEDQKIFDKPN